MKRQSNLSQLEWQEKISEIATNETKINNLLDKKLKALVVWIVTELGKRIDAHSEDLNKELEIIRKNQSEL